MAVSYCVCGHRYEQHHDFTAYGDMACTVDDELGAGGLQPCWCEGYERRLTHEELHAGCDSDPCPDCEA